MLRNLEYKGRSISLTVLPEQGRWGYRIDDGPVRTLDKARAHMDADHLYREAEAAAKAEIDATDNRRVTRRG